MAHSLYVHIPFCLTKCPYCSFISFPDRSKEVQDEYVNTVLKELEMAKQYANNSPLKSIYIGGGTPTLLSEKNLSNLFTGCYEFKEVAADVEVTIEANPKTVDSSKLKILKSLGVTRLSIGIQSFNDDELHFLGRPYSARDAEEIISLAQGEGFENLSLDLMYGLHEQTLEKWKASLEKAISYDPKHLSIYQLTIEDGTPFREAENAGKINLPEEDIIEDIDNLTWELTEKAKIERYEISNYAKKKNKSFHNVNYWKNNEYYGIGAGAVEYLSGQRRFKFEDTKRYIKRISAGKTAIKMTEDLTREESFRETVVIGLRMVSGVNLKDVEARFKINAVDYYGEKLTKLMKSGCIKIENDMMFLTDLGMKYGNSVMADLV